MEILESGVGPMLQPPDLDSLREINRRKPEDPDRQAHVGGRSDRPLPA